ncbi:cuticle protein 8-like [Penaeus japonicus]|uniref:cuticle protein 8-like n=1 Tax=Penaeus japonicus TaxID=27405 RepID=UPI001C70DBBD|nr:cuticle protein 8-like [Penaeus japonicus]
MFKSVLLLIAVAVLAALAAGRSTDPYHHSYPEAPAVYDFQYGVKDDLSGNNYGHEEARNGYNTKGQYFVLLPDGRLQTVQYTVNGDEGFVASVGYSRRR